MPCCILMLCSTAGIVVVSEWQAWLTIAVPLLAVSGSQTLDIQNFSHIQRCRQGMCDYAVTVYDPAAQKAEDMHSMCSSINIAICIICVSLERPPAAGAVGRCAAARGRGSERGQAVALGRGQPQGWHAHCCAIRLPGRALSAGEAAPLPCSMALSCRLLSIHSVPRTTHLVFCGASQQQSSAPAGAAATMRLWGTLISALRGERDCGRWAPYDFFSAGVVVDADHPRRGGG